MMEHYKIFTSDDHCTYMQRHPENNTFRTITNMDQVQRTSIKIKINPKTQALLKKKFLALVQKQTRSELKTHMTIFVIWTIFVKSLTLLIHKNNSWKTMSLKI